MDWSGLKCGGCNGMFLVLVSLSWWAVCDDSDVHIADISSATDDVLWVFEQMSKSTIGKRATSVAVFSPSPSKRPRID